MTPMSQRLLNPSAQFRFGWRQVFQRNTASCILFTAKQGRARPKIGGQAHSFSFRLISMA